ncbi:MAG: hypothetical protein RJA70_4242, partial [Pseudomonadota bacterium]
IVMSSHGPPENILFALNLLKPSSGNLQRAEVRALHGSVVLFRSVGDERDEYGFTYSVSATGLYIRSLLPPPAERLWLEIQPPNMPRRVRLVGRLAWMRGFGEAGAETAPPGFGVQIVDGLGKDLDLWLEGFNSLDIRAPDPHEVPELKTSSGSFRIPLPSNRPPKSEPSNRASLRSPSVREMKAVQPPVAASRTSPVLHRDPIAVSELVVTTPPNGGAPPAQPVPFAISPTTIPVPKEVWTPPPGNHKQDALAARTPQSTEGDSPPPSGPASVSEGAAPASQMPGRGNDPSPRAPDTLDSAADAVDGVPTAIVVGEPARAQLPSEVAPHREQPTAFEATRSVASASEDAPAITRGPPTLPGARGIRLAARRRSRTPLVVVLGAAAALGAFAFALTRPSATPPLLPQLSTTGATPALAAAPAKSAAVPPPPASPSTVSQLAEPSGATTTSLPTEAPTAQAATNAPSEPPAGVQTIPSPPTPPADLSTESAYLYVQSSSGAKVFVHGVEAGNTNEWVETKCGARFIRLGRAPGQWSSKGLPHKLKCRAANEIRLDPDE